MKKRFKINDLSFEVSKDLMNYKIEKELDDLALLFARILEKSNETAVKDLCLDISSSLRGVRNE